MRACAAQRTRTTRLILKRTLNTVGGGEDEEQRQVEQ